MKMGIEKIVLFVDDQWGKEDERVVEATYDIPGYRFIKEDAFDGISYSALKVLDRVKSEKDIAAVVLDMDFTHEYGSDRCSEGLGYGQQILRALVQNYPEIPVFMHSSSEKKDLREECMRLGAKAWLVKKATAREMKETLDKYCK